MLNWLHNMCSDDIAAAEPRVNDATRRAATIPVGSKFQMGPFNSLKSIALK